MKTAKLKLLAVSTSLSLGLVTGIPQPARGQETTPPQSSLGVGPGSQIQGPGSVVPVPPQNRPRELVLTFADGEYAEPVKSAVTLSCTSSAGVPAPQDTHPEMAQACLDLEMAKATLAGLPKDPNTMCPMIYQPVTVTISGTWDGKLVWERATYGNRCELAHKTGAVFLEWPDSGGGAPASGGNSSGGTGSTHSLGGAPSSGPGGAFTPGEAGGPSDGGPENKSP